MSGSRRSDRRSAATPRPARTLAHLAAVSALAAALAGCAPSDGDKTTEQTPAPATGELLIAKAPEGWVQAGGLNQGNLRIAEFADPATLTPDQVDTVRFESQAGDPLPDPIDFVLGLREELRGNCQGLRDFPIFSGYENGYPASVRLMFCRSQGEPERGLVRMVKAIRGKEFFYIVSRSRTSAPFEPEAEPLSVQDMAEWSTWIGGITVCDTREAEHPCPQPPADAEQAD